MHEGIPLITTYENANKWQYNLTIYRYASIMPEQMPKYGKYLSMENKNVIGI
jgi:hypothetical protein